MTDNRMFLDNACSLAEAIQVRDHYRDMLRDDGVRGWVAGYDKFARGVYRVYIRPLYGDVPQPRERRTHEPQDDSQSVPVARAHRRLASRAQPMDDDEFRELGGEA